MKKILIVGALFVGLAGCNDPIPQEQWVTGKNDMSSVKGFEDCFFAILKTNENSNPIVVIRCPNSSTNVNYRVGKNTVHQVSTIDSSVVDHRVGQLEQQVREQDELIRRQQESLRTSLTLIKKEGN